MNPRSELLLDTYKPKLCITVYKSETSGFYLESHEIDADGSVLAGKPLLQETIQGMVGVFFDENMNKVKVGGMIPENLLSFKFRPGGKYEMVWFRPAEVRVMHFAPQLKLKTAKVWVPAMVYKVDRSLSVFAIKSNARPKEETKLYTAPFHNIYSDGTVCLGNATVKKPKTTTYANIMQYWEDLFWLSEFTHLNGDNKTKSDMGDVWSKLIASKEKLKWSDLNELLPFKKSKLSNIL